MVMFQAPDAQNLVRIIYYYRNALALFFRNFAVGENVLYFAGSVRLAPSDTISLAARTWQREAVQSPREEISSRSSVFVVLRRAEFWFQYRGWLAVSPFCPEQSVQSSKQQYLPLC